MPSYENEICPVCGRKFTSEDDIVTCPHCGTPHHRECYNSLGHCAYSERHGTDFSFTPNAADTKTEGQQTAESDSQKYYQPPVNNSDKTKCVKCGAEIDKDAPFCSKCGERQPSPEFKEYKSPVEFNFGFNNAESKTGYENSRDTIDGKSVSDAANVVRTNTLRFIPKFLENKKSSWNWGAFIFGPYYLFFRKMYKEGTIFLAVKLIVSLISQGLYAKPYAELSRFIMSNYDKLTDNPTNEMIKRMTELSSAVMPMFFIIIGATLITHIIIGVFADSFYRAKVISVLSKVDQKLEEGGMFDQSFTIMENEVPFSQEEMKKLYLEKLGGTSIFSPIMAFFVYDIITSIISGL